jgi:hypothetical protein
LRIEDGGLKFAILDLPFSILGFHRLGDYDGVDAKGKR